MVTGLKGQFSAGLTALCWQGHVQTSKVPLSGLFGHHKNDRPYWQISCLCQSYKQRQLICNNDLINIHPVFQDRVHEVSQRYKIHPSLGLLASPALQSINPLELTANRAPTQSSPPPHPEVSTPVFMLSSLSALASCLRHENRELGDAGGRSAGTAILDSLVRRTSPVVNIWADSCGKGGSEPPALWGTAV